MKTNKSRFFKKTRKPRFFKIFLSQLQFKELLFVTEKGHTRRGDFLLKFYLAVWLCTGHGKIAINRKVKRNVCRLCKIRKSQFWSNLKKLEKLGFLFTFSIPKHLWYKPGPYRRVITHEKHLKQFSGKYILIPKAKGIFTRPFNIRGVIKTAISNNSHPSQAHYIANEIIPDLTDFTARRRDKKHTEYINKTFTGRERKRVSFIFKIQNEKNLKRKMIDLAVQLSRDDKAEIKQIEWYKTKIVYHGNKRLLACMGKLYQKDFHTKVYRRIWPVLKSKQDGVKWCLPDSVFANQAKPRIPREVLIKDNENRFKGRLTREQIESSEIYKRFAKKK